MGVGRRQCFGPPQVESAPGQAHDLYQSSDIDSTKPGSIEIEDTLEVRDSDDDDDAAANDAASSIPFRA
jgi:hypothetical protein